MSYIRKRKPKKRGIIAEEIIADERTLQDWISAHLNTLIYAGGAILFVLLITFGIVWMKTQKAKAASQDLADALGFYWSTVAGLPSEEYDSDILKLEQTLENFDDVASRHRKTPQGQTAVLYKANVLYRLGRFREAALTLEELDSRNPSFVSHINARYLLGKSYEAMGDNEKAIEVYSRIRESALGDMRAVLAMDMARCSELAGDVQGAISLYQEIISEFPDSPFATRSEEKLATMGIIDQEEL